MACVASTLLELVQGLPADHVIKDFEHQFSYKELSEPRVFDVFDNRENSSTKGQVYKCSVDWLPERGDGDGELQWHFSHLGHFWPLGV